MRGNVLAALVAAAIIALLSVWRISEKSSMELVDSTALTGTWVRAETEACNPPLPDMLSIADDGRYLIDNGAGRWRHDDDGRFILEPVADEYPNRIFRANSERLELLNQLGCKAIYARAK